jgi:ferredoxin
MERKIIEIDQEKCTGCGVCIPNCPEGAIQLIDDKARLISDIFCDGLGACLGDCPEGAITQVVREAESYDERKTMVNIANQGTNTIKAHLMHLKNHGETEYYHLAIEYLQENNIPIPIIEPNSKNIHKCDENCLGSKIMDLKETHEIEKEPTKSEEESVLAVIKKSELTNWPIQIKLLPIQASFYKDADILLAADCVAGAFPNFHSTFVKGKAVMIGCPKLDDANFYISKLSQIFKFNSIRSVHVVMMEVPCCSGLNLIAKKAIEVAGKQSTIPLTQNIINISGSIKI